MTSLFLKNMFVNGPTCPDISADLVTGVLIQHVLMVCRVGIEFIVHNHDLITMRLQLVERINGTVISFID